MGNEQRRRKVEGGRGRARSSLLAPRTSRRGVLLLVVLSMLVLFMLIGTAFLMTSDQQRTAAKGAAKQNRLGNNATRLLDRAILHLVRDSDNAYSVIRYHSLLRDLYGTDGFQGVIYSPADNIAFAPADPVKQVTRFAGADAGNATAQLGPTAGQFIDIYVSAGGYKEIDYTAVYNGIANPLDLRNGLKLDRNVYAEPQPYALPLTKGYFNGCMLTITSGPAAGQSARILDYEYITELAPAAGGTPPTAAIRLFRFRVMSFQRSDGQPLQINPDAKRNPEIVELGGEVRNDTRISASASFIVNGRAFGGTGVGYNPLAQTGQPRLSALQKFTIGAETYGAEIALMPNSVFGDGAPLGNMHSYQPTPGIPAQDPFMIGTGQVNSVAAGSFIPINNATGAASLFPYQSFVGPGGANESYDAADHNNMFLAIQTVSPRSQGRVMQEGTAVPLDVVEPTLDPAKFLRLDLEDLPMPSFHRPDLMNFWYHRMFNSTWLKNQLTDPNERAKAILLTVDTNGQPVSSVQIAGQIASVKRRISLRPLREDHPQFDGSNPLSVPQGLPATLTREVPAGSGNYVLAIPYWEAVGPWDIDNDNDGVRDSIWIDLGDPILQTEDGRRYKTLYAILCVDLDSRLNVNAHGLADNVVPQMLGLSRVSATTYQALPGTLQSGLVRQNSGTAYTPQPLTAFGPGPNLAGSTNTLTYSSQLLASGLGFGPAEISLRPAFAAPLGPAPNYDPIYGNRDESAGQIDGYQALLTGRQKVDKAAVTGRYGFESTPVTSAKPGFAVTPGINYDYSPDNQQNPMVDNREPEAATQLKFFGYPWRVDQASEFGTPPDLFSRYALGVDYSGQPFYETLYDRNPNSSNLPPSLLTDVPYELNLGSRHRRDSWAASFSNATNAFNQSLVQNDDAAFSPTDLEKVLRGWDADVGTLPSRLWDVANDFDPVKLINSQYGDPNRVTAVANAAFGSNGPPALLAAAQQIAGINRRLVTTESFGLPVTNEDFRKELIYGADQQPGVPGKDDNTNTIIDDLPELNTVSFADGSDDYVPVMVEVRTRTSSTTFGAAIPTNPRILDYLRYRVVLELLRRNVILPSVPRTDAQVDGLINSIIYSGSLLAPETVAGMRMDLNRPFGDGRDNPDFVTGTLNGVVDDPLEAGDPFLDGGSGTAALDGNGKYDNGEPYIDMDGSGQYTPPADKLWQGLTSEPIEFDYTNGVEIPVHTDAITPPPQGGVRNLESHGRQLMARHLYCMMLLLVDENYIAPWDENDPQLIAWMDKEKKKLTDPPLSVPAANADFIVKRKHTCRTIAQWAVNCVDMRDSDVIQTPFEYDENPWDGWGVLDSNASGVQLIPLDGDPVTNENKGEIIDWNSVKNDGKKAFKAVANLPIVLNQTRGVVWGAERPELLITETLAVHDRRTEDLTPPNGGHETITPQHRNDPRFYADTDLDQSLRPRGSLFVEIHNPWSSDGQYPAELYRYPGNIPHLDPAAPANQPDKRYFDPSTGKALEGVLLNRMSDFGVDGNGNLTSAASTGVIKRSPVWRMIVVEEWPNAKNTGDMLSGNRTDLVLKQGVTQPKAYADMAAKFQTWAANPTGPPPFRPTDPDFDVAFDINYLPKQMGSNNQFEIQYPYIEREFYFTTDNSPTIPTNGKPMSPSKPADWDYSATKFKLRIPNRSIQISITAGAPLKVQTQKFIPHQVENPPSPLPVIAPIVPGRYGVIGSASTNYSFDPLNPYANPNAKTYTSTLGRNNLAGIRVDGNDTTHNPTVTRRIELRPNADPREQQVRVAGNGGDPKDEGKSPTSFGITYDPFSEEIGRDNEIINDRDTAKNIQASKTGNDGTPTPTPNSRYYQPCVAIPVEGMNVSEPPWGYGPREKEATTQQQRPDGLPSEFRWSFEDKYEGRYYFSGGAGSAVASYDKPFDTAPELMRTGTTANYRVIHLQRLANPLLPWNPERFLADGVTQNPDWKPNLPINPYRTVDSSSVNLTSFCGTSLYEIDLGDQKKRDEAKFRPWIIGLGGSSPAGDLQGYIDMYKAGKQVWYFRSQERGFWSRLNYAGSSVAPPAQPTWLPQRVLWAQEPAMIKLTGRPGTLPEMFDLIAGRQMTMRGDEIPDEVRQSQNIQNNKDTGNFCNMVLEHSLGFGNKSWGLLYDAQGAKQSGTPAGSLASSAIPNGLSFALAGAPAPSRFIFTHNVDPNNGNITGTPTTVSSTNPWLAWDNRPYVSAEEILKVPAASQAQMLRQYSTIDPNLAPVNRPNPYGLAALGSKFSATPVPNTIRWAVMQAPFGNLVNMFAASVEVADVVRDPATGAPKLNANQIIDAYGAPNFHRILEYVQVPSRFVGTETFLNAETFNDVPTYVSANEPFGFDIAGPGDPRYFFQPPFNRVSRQRDPGRVNLNTVTGRRTVDATGVPHVWSEVYDGIMHRYKNRLTGAGDDNMRDTTGVSIQFGHSGPAWRDVVLSRRGYAQFNADNVTVPVDKSGAAPDTFEFGLNNNFPTVFANPFRSPDAGDLVPLVQMMQFGVDASMERVHPRTRGLIPGNPPTLDPKWGDPAAPIFSDARDAGFGNDGVSFRANAAIPNDDVTQRDILPLFSENRGEAFSDTDRNPAMMYQPMSRLGNLVTNRSGVFAVWITVGYFEVEPAPSFSNADVQTYFGGDGAANSPATQAALALYNRVYPDGYMLGKELGSETGDVKRPRGFYIIDRTEEVGFKPGEDLNVEKTIRLRRRIE